jgi:integrase
LELKMPRSKPAKPTKPYPEFPLTAHANGQWCKKIKGRVRFFGTWDDPSAALRKYLDERDELQAGREPRLSQRLSSGATLTVRELWNRYLHFQRQRADAGEISNRWWLDMHNDAARMLRFLGRDIQIAALRPEDFARFRVELGKHYGPVVVTNAVSRTKSLFKWAYETELIEKPVRFGSWFKPPARKVMRQHRHSKGLRMFSSAEVRQMLAVARQPLAAMLLLGLNCGFGNTDCSWLPQSALDLEGGWVTWPRPKTGVHRRCPLWPETVASIREAIADRPAPANAEHDELVFLTRIGEPWVRVAETINPDGSVKRTSIDSVTREFAKLVRKAKVYRPGLNYYAFRHTFRTVADAVLDRGAIDTIMGHAADASDMRAVYVEHVADARLLRVSEHVRLWLLDGTSGSS